MNLVLDILVSNIAEHFYLSFWCNLRTQQNTAGLEHKCKATLHNLDVLAQHELLMYEAFDQLNESC